MNWMALARMFLSPSETYSGERWSGDHFTVNTTVADSFSSLDHLGHISEEVDFVTDLLGGTTVLLVVAVLLLVATGTLMISRLVQGWTRRHRLTTLNNPAARLWLYIALLGFSIAAMFRFFIVHVPVIATVAAAAGAAAMGFAAFHRVLPWVSGILLLLNRKIRIDDTLETGNLKGTVEKVGLFRIALVDEDGARVYLKVSTIGSDAVTVASPGKPHAVEFVYRTSDRTPVSAERAKQLQDRAIFCPYRLATSPVQNDSDPDIPHLLRLRFKTWSKEAAVQAVDFMERWD